MAPTEGRVTRPEGWWGCRHGAPKVRHKVAGQHGLSGSWITLRRTRPTKQSLGWKKTVLEDNCCMPFSRQAKWWSA